MESVKIDTLHTEHREWLNKLNFYKEDLGFLKKRLEEVVVKNNASDIMALVEHFQNQFIIQKNEMDEFRHAIKEHENLLEKSINDNPTASDHRNLADHPEMRERMERFEKIFQELRMEMLRFVSKHI